MKHATRWSGFLLLELAGACLGQIAALLVASDSCLDAGGSFHYASGLCDFKASHSGIDVQSSWQLWLGLFSLVAGALTVWRSFKA